MTNYEFCIKQNPPSITEYINTLANEIPEELSKKVMESLYKFIEDGDSLAEELQGNYF